MRKLLTVFGATGLQGGSVISSVLEDTDLAKQFAIRGITRNSSKPESHILRQQGVEVVEADANDEISLKEALKGSNVVFLVTATIFDERARVRELAQGKAMADAGVAAGAELLIFSSLTNANKTSDGKYKNVVHFDAKAEIEDYIRTLPIRSAFIALGSYMQNLKGALAPHPVGDGSYAIMNCFSPKTQLPLVNASDLGKWVTAALIEPTKYEGTFVAAATKIYSMNEIVKVMTEVSGKTITYSQVTEEVMRGYLPTNQAVLADDMIEMAHYYQDYGYFGRNMKEMVDIGSGLARGKLTTLEEYLSREPPILQ